jgi:hypothetical protein
MRGLRQNVGDMLRSMAVVLVVVGAILLVTWRPAPEAVKEVSLEPLVSIASNRADFPIFVAGSDFQPTSVRWESTQASQGEYVWHVGYVAPGDEYLQLTQSSAEGPAYLAEQTAQGEPLGDFAELPRVVQQLTSKGWVPFEGADSQPRRSLVRTNDGSTTIISGTGPWSQIGDAALSLRLP